MADERKAGGEARPLFSNLVASRPPREGRSAATATAASIAVHSVIVAGLAWATMSVARPANAAQERMVLYTPVPEAPPPPPPPAPPMPRPPQTPEVEKVVAKLEVAAPKPTVEPEAKGFKTLTPPTVTPPDIPPPSLSSLPVREEDYSGVGAEGGSGKGTAALAAQKSVTAEDVSAAPTFTPFTVAPHLKNRDQVSKALERFYPEMLREAGVGGRVLVWFFIDEGGKVRKFEVKESSGHDALDKAALKVADVMEFSPALNRDQRVPVWVALPIVFSTGGTY